jgi:hypothetical protein
VLTLVGVLGVHQARFLFAAPEHEHAPAAAHAYLTWLTPVTGVLLFLAVTELAAHIGRLDDEGVPRLPRARTLWLSATITLLCVFGAQESLETFFSHGHLPALAEPLGNGGWTVVPFSIVAGGAIGVLLRGAATVVGWVLARRAHTRRGAAPTSSPPRPPALAPRASVLARRLAGRAPPALS